MVNSLAVHTSLFRAAASLSGISNLTSRMAGGAHFGREWMISGPSRMEKEITEAPLRYILNSPSAYLGNATTPLLLVTGSEDLHVHHTQSEEMFRGLAQLGKPAELVRVQHAGHGEPWFLDAAYGRALDWFSRWFEEASE